MRSDRLSICSRTHCFPASVKRYASFRSPLLVRYEHFSNVRSSTKLRSRFPEIKCSACSRLHNPAHLSALLIEKINISVIDRLDVVRFSHRITPVALRGRTQFRVEKQHSRRECGACSFSLVQDENGVFVPENK